MPTMLSLQACFKRVALLVFTLSCFIGRSRGFQVSPAFTKRRSHQISNDLVNSFRPSFAPSPVQQGNDKSCLSYMALLIEKQRHSCALNLYQRTNDGNCHISKSQLSPPFDHCEVRLHAAEDDDDGRSPKSSKLRSFISKIFNVLARPVVRRMVSLYLFIGITRLLTSILSPEIGDPSASKVDPQQVEKEK